MTITTQQKTFSHRFLLTIFWITKHGKEKKITSNLLVKR